MKLPTQPKHEQRDSPRLKALFLAQVQFQANSAHDPHDVNGFKHAQTQFSLSVTKVSDDPTVKHRQVHLYVQLQRKDENDQSEQPPYLGVIEVVAEVEFQADATAGDELLNQISIWFTGSALLGAARVYVDTITAIGPFPRTTFGIVNLGNVLAQATFTPASLDAPSVPIYPELAEQIEAAQASS